jgi:hypothetical protein
VALARLEALKAVRYFRGAVLEEREEEFPLSAAKKAVFVGKEAQLPSAGGAPSQEAALESQAKARLPVFEAEPHSPYAAPTEGRPGNSPPLQAELRSRTDAPEEEVTARAPVPAADLKALA